MRFQVVMVSYFFIENLELFLIESPLTQKGDFYV